MKRQATSTGSVLFNRCFELPNPGLRAYFDHVESGQPKVFDTPFSRGESTQEMLNNWMAELESIRNKWPSLFDFEIDLAKKVGPMSVMKPLNDRISDIDHYYDDILLPSQPIDDRAISAVMNEFGKLRGLRIRSEPRTIDLMKKSTNSGSPYFTKRRRVLENYRNFESFLRGSNPNILLQMFQDKSTGKWLQYDGCAVLGWRGQEGGPLADDVKQRVVWMFPLSVNINELQLYQPFIESAQLFGLVPAWNSMELVDRTITKLFDSKDSNDLVICTDFSKFDQHFNPHMADVAYKVYSSVLTPSDMSDMWLDEVFPIKYNIPLAYDYGKLRLGKHGMGSGSGGTNCDETIAHRSLQYEAAITKGVTLNPNSQCLGDDGVISYPGITVEDVVETYTSHGLEMNEDKQYASTQDCVYLRRWHHKDYRIDGVCAGVYSTCRALGHLRYLERYQDPIYWGPKAVALRQLSIIENVKYHPLRDQFAEFCMKRDKYRLGIDIPGFLDNLRNVGNELIENMPDLLGYVRSLQTNDPLGGIENWWIVKYLKSKR